MQPADVPRWISPMRLKTAALRVHHPGKLNEHTAWPRDHFELLFGVHPCAGTEHSNLCECAPRIAPRSLAGSGLTGVANDAGEGRKGRTGRETRRGRCSRAAASQMTTRGPPCFGQCATIQPPPAKKSPVWHSSPMGQARARGGGGGLPPPALT